MCVIDWLQEPWRKEDFLSIETHSLERAYIDKEEVGTTIDLHNCNNLFFLAWLFDKDIAY